MKILLDECCPRTLKNVLPGHEIATVRTMGWGSFKNGALISIADPLFDVMITIDKNLRYQQNLSRIRMSILMLDVPNNRLGTVMAKATVINEFLSKDLKSGYFEI